MMGRRGTFRKVGSGMVGDGPGGAPFVGAATPAVVTVAAPHPDKPMRVSAGVTVGLLMAPIRPVYPQIAKAAHVEGAVVVEAIISKAGCDREFACCEWAGDAAQGGYRCYSGGAVSALSVEWRAYGGADDYYGEF